MTGIVRRLIPAATVALIVSVGALLAAGSSYAGGKFIFEAKFGTRGAGVGEFEGIFNAAVEQESGDLFVADSENQRIQIFDPDGNPVTNEAHEAVVINGSEVPGGAFHAATGVAVDNSETLSRGDVYVADEGSKVVDKFAPNGSSPNGGYKYVCQLTGIGGDCVSAGGVPVVSFGAPSSVAVDGQGNVYVAQAAGNGMTSGSVEEFTTEGTDVKQFSVPAAAGVAVSPSGGVIYAVDGLTASTVELVVNPQTHQLEREEVIDSEGSTAVTVAPTTGEVFVDDFAGEPHVNVYEANPEAGEEPVERLVATEPGQLGISFGVAYSSLGNGRVYVTDLANEDVHIYAREAGSPPTLECQPAAEIVADAAKLECSVEPAGPGEVEWHLEYRKVGSAVWIKTPGGALASAGTIGERIALEPETEYVYRGSATNELGETGRSTKTRFTTPVAFELIAARATQITSTSAVLAGEVNPEGVESHSLFDYGLTTSYGASIEALREGSDSNDDGGGTTPVHVSGKLEGLEPHKIYHYRLKGENVIGERGNGQDAEFETLPAPPAVSATVSGVGRKSATLSGTVNPENSSTTYHFIYGPGESYGMETPDASAGGEFGEKTVGPVDVSGLRPETTYHFRLVASSEDDGVSVGTSRTADQTFTTGAAILPTVQAGEASAITQTSATITDTIDPEGQPTSWELQLGADTGQGGGARIYGQAVEGEETIVLELRDLVPGTTYHYRIVASNEGGSAAGRDAVFTTLGVPSLIAQPPTAMLLVTPSIVFPTEPGKVIKPSKRRRTSAKKGKPGKKRRAKKGIRKGSGRHG